MTDEDNQKESNTELLRREAENMEATGHTEEWEQLDDEAEVDEPDLD